MGRQGENHQKEKMCPLGVIYEELPAPVITFLLPVFVGLAGLKAHNSNAAVYLT